MKNYTDIEPSELADLITKGKILLVDVRNNDEVAQGMIPGASHIHLSTLPVQYEKLKKSSGVVFYCHSGIRSAHAADFVASKGVENVQNLTGGILAWMKAGYHLTNKR